MRRVLQQANFSGLNVRISETRKIPSRLGYISEFVEKVHWLIELETTHQHEFLDAGFWNVHFFRRKEACLPDAEMQFRVSPLYLAEPYEAIAALYHVTSLSVGECYDAIVLELLDYSDGVKRLVPVYINHDNVPPILHVPKH